MALAAGVMTVTVEFAQGLKDSDWFGRQDPYCLVRCGGQQYRTKTHVDGGRNPVWNETFSFNVINENTVELEVKDEDVGRDDLIGTVTFSLAKAREQGADHLQAPVVSKKSKKQRGFVSIAVKFTANDTLKSGSRPAQQQPTVAYYAPGAPPVAAYYAPLLPPPGVMHYPGAAYALPTAMPGYAPAAQPVAYGAYPQMVYQCQHH